MKRSVYGALVIALTLSATLSTLAQNIRFGVFADPQASWFTSNTNKFKPEGMVMGFNSGFSFERFFAERYAFTTGLSINNIGGKLVNDIEYTLETIDDVLSIAENSTVRFKGQYINVPFGFKLKTNEIGYTTFFAQFGVKGHIRMKGYIWEEANDVEREVLENKYSNLIFLSYMIGGGIEYSLGGPSAVQVGVIYTNGITSAFKTGSGIISIGSAGLRLGLVF